MPAGHEGESGRSQHPDRVKEKAAVPVWLILIRFSVQVTIGREVGIVGTDLLSDAVDQGVQIKILQICQHAIHYEEASPCMKQTTKHQSLAQVVSQPKVVSQPTVPDQKIRIDDHESLNSSNRQRCGQTLAEPQDNNQQACFQYHDAWLVVHLCNNQCERLLTSLIMINAMLHFVL